MNINVDIDSGACPINKILFEYDNYCPKFDKDCPIKFEFIDGKKNAFSILLFNE